MKRLLVVALIFTMPFAAYGQSDPNGYAVICNDTCTIMLPDELGSATQVTVSQGYVLDRIDLTPGQSITVPSNESVVADPSDSLIIGTVGATIPEGSTNTAMPAITANPIKANPITP